MIRTVYVHFGKRTGLPFYVGVGNSYRKNSYGNRSCEWKAKRKSEGGLIISFSELTKEDAFKEEVRLIKLYGRIPEGGTLINQSIGGYGSTKGITKNKTWRLKLSKSLKGHEVPDIVRHKISKSLMGNTINKGRVHSEQSKRNMSIGALNRKK